MKKNRGFWTVFILLVILVRVEGSDLFSDESKDLAERILCQTTGFRCPQGNSRMEHVMENLTQIDFKQLVASFKTLGEASAFVIEHAENLQDIEDVDYEFKKRLERIASEFRRVDTEAFSALSNAKEFCITSSRFITDFLTDTINNNFDFSKLKLDVMIKQVSDLIAQFSRISDLLSRVEEESSRIEEHAGRLSEEYHKKSTEIRDRGSADWVNYAVILGTVVGCAATGGILNPLCVGGVASSFGSMYATNYFDNLNEEEKKRFMQQSEAYKHSKELFFGIMENLELYQGKLQVFRDSVDDVGTTLIQFGGAYYGNRVYFKRKADDLSMHLESVAELMADFMETIETKK